LKKFCFISLILFLFFLVGCSKKMKFEVPDGDITIVKKSDDHCFGGVKYKPLIINDDKEKDEIIKKLNSWRLVEDNKIQKESCNLYTLTWENHNVTIYGGNESISGVVIDKESYDIVDGNIDFLDDYIFEELD
jgi:hypothetical protein